MNTAPLSSRLFMLPREIPSYLTTAYSLRYSDSASLFVLFKRYVVLAIELIFYRPHPIHLTRNCHRLQSDFLKLNEAVKENKKPICAYFVSAHDNNGAILGDHLYYYHHYKIRNIAKHFAVAASVVATTQQLFNELQRLKESFPDREIRLVDIVAHGSPDDICIADTRCEHDGETCEVYSKSSMCPDEFKDVAKDASIIIDACSTGMGTCSVAEKIAMLNPGKRVFAPATGLYFTKPVIKTQNGKPTVDHVVHGPALFLAYTAAMFLAPDKLSNQLLDCALPDCV